MYSLAVHQEGGCVLNVLNNVATENHAKAPTGKSGHRFCQIRMQDVGDAVPCAQEFYGPSVNVHTKHTGRHLTHFLVKQATSLGFLRVERRVCGSQMQD